jgi:hypothetical protein
MFREKIAGGAVPTLYQASRYRELSQNNGNRLRNDVGWIFGEIESRRLPGSGDDGNFLRMCTILNHMSGVAIGFDLMIQILRATITRWLRNILESHWRTKRVHRSKVIECDINNEEVTVSISKWRKCRSEVKNGLAGWSEACTARSIRSQTLRF